MRVLLVLLCMVSYALSDSCVVQTFEEGYPDSFINALGMCGSGASYWNIGKYEDTELTGQNELSTKFIYSPSYGCMSTLMFPMKYGGTVEVHLFLAPADNNIIEVWVMKTMNHFDYVVGYSGADSFVSGWRTLSIRISGEDKGEFTGYISFLGVSDTSHAAIIDSFRYIPPGMDESECIIYPPLPTTTETTPGTESTTTTEIPIDVESTTTTEATPGTESTSSDVDVESTTKVTTDGTELPTTLPDSDDADDTFWTPLRLGVLALLSILILILLCSFCYCCCLSKTTVVVV